MKLIAVFYIAGIFLMCGCNLTDNNCTPKSFRFGNKEYRAEGCLTDSVENGEWHFYNEAGMLVEKGQYESGIRQGKWSYPANQSDSIIFWKKFIKPELGLVFNIPSRLFVIEDSADYIKFSNKDSLKLFNVVLAVHNLKESKKEFDNYYLQGEEEIKANGWTFNSNKNKIIVREKIFYFNDYKITMDPANSFRVLNAYRNIGSDGKLLEISCRYNESIELSARIIFFSVLTSTFYNKERFINPFEKIEIIKVN